LHIASAMYRLKGKYKNVVTTFQKTQRTVYSFLLIWCTACARAPHNSRRNCPCVACWQQPVCYRALKKNPGLFQQHMRKRNPLWGEVPSPGNVDGNDGEATSTATNKSKEGGTSEVHRPQFSQRAAASAHPQAGPDRSPPPPSGVDTTACSSPFIDA
jgi:hypothetical protein